MTVMQGAASLTPAVIGSSKLAARSPFAATLVGEAIFSSMPDSLFDLLQNLMDAEQWDPATRTDALSALVAYHAATLSDDKLSAIHAINRIHKDAELLLAHMWGVYSGGVYGVYAMPVDRLAGPQLSEIVKQVATTRAARGHVALKVQS